MNLDISPVFLYVSGTLVAVAEETKINLNNQIATVCMKAVKTCEGMKTPNGKLLSLAVTLLHANAESRD
jgi:hypothetical protein